MAEQRMSAQLTRLAKKRGRLPALVAALGLALLLLLQSLLTSLSAWIGGALYARVSFGAESFELGQWQVNYFIDPVLKSTLPFALGVFISLWLIAPLAAELTLRFVLTRALLAATAGALLVTLVSVVVDFVSMLKFGFDVRGLAHSGILAISQGVNAFIYTTPVVMFAGVLLWFWLKEHPREYEVTGLIDEL
jgi:hypothetical protein